MTNLLDKLRVVRTVFIQPEDRLCPSSAGAVARELDPVGDRVVLRTRGGKTKGETGERRTAPLRPTRSCSVTWPNQSQPAGRYCRWPSEVSEGELALQEGPLARDSSREG